MFIKKLSEFNDRNPENTLQYIPTANPWTWTASVRTTPPVEPPLTGREHSQYMKRVQVPARKDDSYVPRYESSYIPNYDRVGR